MPKLTNKLLMIVKVLTFISTLLLIICYPYLPKRQMLLHPNEQNTYAISVDSEVGGQSKFIWINQQDMFWDCEINQGAAYPYCGLSLLWSQDLHKTIDFSAYSHLNLTLDYQGPTPYFRVFIRDDYPSDKYTDALKRAKFNNITIRARQGEQQVSIPLTELSVAEWWFNDFAVPLENRRPSVKNTIALGIDIPYPVILGEHKFRLSQIELVGSYFSKEIMYISILVFWGVLLILEMLLAYINMQVRLRDGKQQLSELAATSAKYKEQAETDKLTGILNRSGLSEIISQLESSQLLQQYALLIIDVDHFKQVNDTYGHAEGDRILAAIARTVSMCTRSYDVIARWGGEEFVVLMHCFKASSILPFADKIRLKIANTPPLNGVTVSIGATQLLKSSIFNESFELADKALYQAKSSGRNKVVVL
jgi:diguanylate cyclase (GGDEF)-like protein